MFWVARIHNKPELQYRPNEDIEYESGNENMNAFFAMVAELTQYLHNRPDILIPLIIIVGVIVLIWKGKLKGRITFGGDDRNEE